MRAIQDLRVGWFVGIVGACLLTAGVARADVTTERPGSILIFPKVVNDGTRTTIIQITNTGNSPDEAQCFYINGTPDATGTPSCSEVDFFIALTRQQPTHFDVATGRTFTSIMNGVDSAGIPPGQIPPVPTSFEGALVCTEIDSGGVPVARNQLKGEATIIGSAGNPVDASKYNAIAVQGATNGELDGGPTEAALALDGLQYNACPATNVLNMIPGGAPDPVVAAIGNSGICSSSGAPCGATLTCPLPAGVCAAGTCTNGVPGTCVMDSDCAETCNTGLSAVGTNLTVLPCSLDLVGATTPVVTLNYVAFDEFETRTSGGFSFRCWGTFDLSAIIRTTSFAGGGSFANVQISPAPGSSPVVGVAEMFHTDSLNNSGAAAVNLHTEGICNNAMGTGSLTSCTTTADCPSGETCGGLPSVIRVPIE